MPEERDPNDLWFHLGSTDVAQDHIKDVRMPDFDFLDVDEPCFSVAPTVWQCAFAISKPGTLHIHEVDVERPKSAKDKTSDGYVTQEHRVTIPVLEANGGAIPIRCIGQVKISDDLLLDLKIAFHAMRLICDAAQEREFLWNVSGRQWTWRGLSPRQLAQELAQRPA